MGRDRCCRDECCGCHKGHHHCDEKHCKCHKEKKHHRCEKERKRDICAGIFDGCGNISFIIFLILVLLIFSGGIEI